MALVLLDGGEDLNIHVGGCWSLRPAAVTRPSENAAEIDQDVIDAHVWAGIHFRTDGRPERRTPKN
jgi:hypothetical protein